MLFFIFSLLGFKISFYLFFHNRRFLALPISIHSSLVSLENYFGVKLETTFYKWSFSVETLLDSTPIEEVNEAFSFDCKSCNELYFFIPLVPFPNKVEDKSAGVFFLE